MSHLQDETTGEREDSDGEFFSLEQAVQFLGTSKPTLYRWLAQDEIRGFKAGKKWRFRKGDLVAYLQRRPAMPTVPRNDLHTELEHFAAELERANLIAPELPTEENDPETRQVTRLAAQIMTYAIQSKASDIHLEPVKEGSESFLRLRLRIDGVLYDIRRLPASLQEALALCFKQIGHMDMNERRLPQQGRIPYRVAETDYEMRASILPTLFGEEIVLRILHKGNMLLGLENLGLSPEDTARLRELTQQPNGILLVTGPTGSGRTTLLYNLLYEVIGEHRKIVTLEEPVEYQLPYATQVALNSRAGLGFAEGFRALMRHDPDVILLGELADRTTATLAHEAALTGHLFLSAQNAPDAASAVERLFELGIEPFLVSGSLLGVVALRLVRKVCDNCKRTQTVAASELRRYGFEIVNPEETVTLTRGEGCEQCRKTGYRGRTGLFEVLVVQGEIAAAIERGEDATAIAATARANGMRGLREDGLRKVYAGITTPEEVMRVVYTAL